MPVALTGWQQQSEKGSAPLHFSKGGKGGEFRSAVGLNHRIGTPTFDASDRFSSWSDASTFTTERSARGQGRRNPDREDAPYIRINKEITDAAVDPYRFQAYVAQLMVDRRTLSMVNVVTILQRAGRNRLRLHSDVVRYLADVCHDLRGKDTLGSRAVGNALYGPS